MVVLLSAAVAWLIFDRFEQQQRFESLVSHLNAIEEGAVLRVEFDGLSSDVEALASRTQAHSESIAKNPELFQLVARRFEILTEHLDAISETHDKNVSAFNSLLRRVGTIEDQIEEAERQARLKTLLDR